MPYDLEIGSESLTGVWQGRFSYGAAEGCAFVATLMELGPHLSGSTHEPNVSGRGDEDHLFAMIEGRRNGRSLSFMKTYDGSAGWTHSVAYEGRVSSDGTEIEGRWSIGDGLAGTFLMLRSGGKSASVAKEAFEEVY
jgi:hypothetical protein